MTGYQSKKAAALDKLAQPAQEPVCPECKAEVLYECVACSSNNYPPKPAQEPVAWMRPSDEGYDSAFRDHSTVVVCTGNPWTGWIPLYTAPPQRPWVEPTGNEWFEWWRVSKVSDETEAEIDFADFLIIAQAVVAKLKENNNGT